MSRADARHPLDLLSLTAGLLAVGLALLWLVADATDLVVRPVGVVALVVAALGAGGLVAAVRRGRPVPEWPAEGDRR